jgi:uncharacterized protein (DUF362 family)
MTNLAKVIIDQSERSVICRVADLMNDVNGLGKITGNVIIKPNICSRKTHKSGATTDPKIVEALVKYFLDQGIDASKILIVESDTAFVNTKRAARKLGYENIVTKYDIKFINLSNVEAVTIRGNHFNGEMQIAKLLLQDKYYISVGKMKTHCQEIISCSLKNQYGCLSIRDKVKFHPYLPEVIADLNHIIRPNLAILDGIYAMEGYGPIKGKSVKMNLIMCSKDLVALDRIACDIMGVNFKRVGHLKLSKALGNIDDIDVIGIDINKVKRKFKHDILRHMIFVLLNRYLKIPK